LQRHVKSFTSKFETYRTAIFRSDKPKAVGK